MAKRTLDRFLNLLGSLQLTLVVLAVLMALVVLCTLAQVNLGTFGAVEVYMRSWFVWWQPTDRIALPVLPGGALAGLALLANLVTALVQRFTWSAKKAGLWIVHTGLILLVAGEFVTGALQVEHSLAFEEGQTVNYIERARHFELAVIDTSDPAADEVYGIPEARLAQGGQVALPGTPITLRLKAFHRNAELSALVPGATPSGATAGIGPSVQVTPRPPVASDDHLNLPAVLVEPVAGGRSYGTWLASPALGAPQAFIHEGRTYRLEVRLERTYLPFALTLKDFRHDVYPGTTIPKNFSSLVRLEDPSRGESRDVLIYMNQPLRYDGKAFYQASFGKNDTLSILQVVENPGWLIPYLSCTLVTLGLLWHFAVMLRRPRKEAA